MTARDHIGVLLAAHGERSAGASNDGLRRLANELAERAVAAEVRCAFINGSPSVGEALGRFATREILVYPMFLSHGYFTRVRLPRLVAEAADRGKTVCILPPFGLDPALAELIADKAAAAARADGIPAERAVVVLVAHGSTKDTASRMAAGELVRCLRAQTLFSEIVGAFLDEPPSLADAIAGIAGPVVVIGLFAGEGLHGREDVPRLIAETRHRDVVFAGNVGAWPEAADIVVEAIDRASREPAAQPPATASA